MLYKFSRIDKKRACTYDRLQHGKTKMAARDEIPENKLNDSLILIGGSIYKNEFANCKSLTYHA